MVLQNHRQVPDCADTKFYCYKKYHYDFYTPYHQICGKVLFLARSIQNKINK